MWENKDQTEPLLKQEGLHGSRLEHDPNFRGITEHGRKWNDLLFTLLFIITCIGMVSISAVAFSQGKPSHLVPSYEYTKDAEVQSKYWFQDAVAQLKQDRDILGGALALAVLIGFGWIQLLRMFTKLFIYLTLFLGVVMIIAVGAYSLSLGVERDDEALRITGYCVFVLAFLLVVAIIFLRQRISLTCELFKETCAGIQYNPAIFAVSLIIIAVFSLFTVYWVASFIYLYSIPSKDTDVHVPNTPYYFNEKIRNLMYFQVFAFFWVTAFISAVFQVSIAGGIATWYFSRDVDGFGKNVGSPTFRSMGRALTKSFGSLALGSLLLATVRFINFLLRIAKRNSKTTKNPVATFLISCVQCIFSCIERFVRFIDKWAYIYIAMHGDGFFSSAKNSFDLIARNMFQALIVDTLGVFVLFVGKLLGTAICTMFTLGLVDALGRHIGSLTIVVVAIISYIVFTLFSHIIGVGVDTVMVCYLEDMERNKDGALYISPDLHRMLQNKANKSRD